MNIGKAIKICRIQRELSQTDLAILAKISVSYLSLLERDKRDPAFSVVEKIAHALNMPLVVITFLASSEEEKSQLSTELRKELSYAALSVLHLEEVAT